jgi:hypothetical protein
VIRFATFAAALLLTTVSINANASTLLARPTSSVSVNSNNPSNTVIGTTSATLQGGSATESIAPFVSVQAEVDNAPGVATQDAFAVLDYYFAAVGGVTGDPVQVLIQTTLSATANAYPTYAFAEISVDNGYASASVCASGDASCTSNGFSGTLDLLIISGEVLDIHIFVGAEVGYFPGGNAFASADPYIFVDPTFNLNHGDEYSIIVSDGVGNALPSTPLPAALPLFASGLGALGLFGWRRKRKNTAAIAA